MRSTLLNLRQYPWLRFLAPDGVVGGGASSGAATPQPVDESLLDALPGGEMLRGATEVKPVDVETAEWNQDDDEEAGDSLKESEPAAARAGEEEGDEEKEEEQQQPAADGKREEQPAAAEIPADWPEEAKTRFAALAGEKEELAKAKQDLTTKVAELEGKVAAGPAPVLAPTRSNPLSFVRDPKGLAANEEFARSLKSFAFRASKDGGELPRDLQAALDGVAPDKITEARTITAEEAQDLYENAEAMLEKHIPARRQYLSEEAAAHAELQQLAPEMLKTDSEDGKLFSSFVQQFPEAKLLSRWPTVMAAVVIGHKVLEGRAAKAKAKATDVQPGNSLARGDTRPTPGGTRPTPIAPGAPAAPKGAAGASNKITKPKPQVQLSASMDADELAALM